MEVIIDQQLFMIIVFMNMFGVKVTDIVISVELEHMQHMEQINVLIVLLENIQQLTFWGLKPPRFSICLL